MGRVASVTRPNSLLGVGRRTFAKMKMQVQFNLQKMQGDEIRALRRLQREQEASPYVERGGFGTLFERLGRRAGMPFTIFPHILRHACGLRPG
jgi:hypothetical protein